MIVPDLWSSRGESTTSKVVFMLGTGKTDYNRAIGFNVASGPQCDMLLIALHYENTFTG